MPIRNRLPRFHRLPDGRPELPRRTHRALGRGQGGNRLSLAATGAPSWSELARRIRGGDRRALARAATSVEDRAPGHEELLRALSPSTGRALVLGVTGAPGSGKSTLTDQLLKRLRGQGRSVAVLAVDPSSPYSGGAILGDRIRMQDHHADPGVFIRSMATRGALGGLAAATRDLVLLFDAAGFDVVVVETVGVGQDEIEVARVAAVTALVLVPGLGDDVQALKAGILEIADVFIVNKSDHPGAARLERDLKAMLDLGAPQNRDRQHCPGFWTPPIVRTIATEGHGVDAALAEIERCAASGAAPRDAVLDAESRLRETSQARALASIGSLDHIGIAVPSLDGALDFYERALGMRVTGRETVESEMVRVAMLAAGPSRLELLEPAAPDSAIAKFIEKRGAGLHHVALRVRSLSAVASCLQQSGARLIGEPRQGAGGHLYLFVHPASTGGVLLELIQDQERVS